MSGSDEQFVGASSQDSITIDSRNHYDDAPLSPPPLPAHHVNSVSLPATTSKFTKSKNDTLSSSTNSIGNRTATPSLLSFVEGQQTPMESKRPLLKSAKKPSVQQSSKLSMASMLSPVSPVHDTRPRRSSGMLSMTELCSPDITEADDKDVVYTDMTSPPTTCVYRDGSRGPHSFDLDMDEIVSTADEDDGDSDFHGSAVQPSTSKKKANKRTKKHMIAPPTFLKGGGGGGLHDGDVEEEEGDEEMDEGWSDHNRWYCNICKDGGELLCCDRCPRAFHMRCLGMKDEAIPDTEWYCKMCSECLDRRRIKRESREKARLMRETEKLERDAKKLQLQQMKEDALAQKSAQAIEEKARRVLEMQDRMLSRRKIKYKDKEEEKLGRLAEELAQTVRTAKEKLANVEKEDAALRKKEEAFNKRNKGDLRLNIGTVEEPSEEIVEVPEKPAPPPCSFGDVPSEYTGQLLAIWDGVMSVSQILQLASISLSAFAAALVHTEHTPLITEIHMCMLDLILEDREEADYVSDDEASMDEMERFRYEVQRAPLTVGVPTSNMLNTMSWPSILYNLIVSVPRYTACASSPSMPAAITALRQVSDYPLLETSHKLQLLQFLVGRVYGTEKVRRWLGTHAGQAIELTKEYNRTVLLDRKHAMEEEKKLRERQRAELLAINESNTNGGGVKDKKKQSEMVGSDGMDGIEEEEVSDSELDDLTEEALVKHEEDLEQQQLTGLITRHEYVLQKKQLDYHREKLRRRADNKNKKQKAQEQLERKRIAAKKSIQDALLSKDAMVLRLAIEKAKEVDLGDRIIVSASHVLEILEAEAAREEEMERKKRKYITTRREFYIRTESLGRDAQGYRYWIFSGDSSRLYVEKPVPYTLRDWYDQEYNNETSPEPPRSTWFAYCTQAEVKSLMESLDLRHPRENALRTALIENFDQLVDGMPVSKPGLLISDLLNDKEEGSRRRGSASSVGSATGSSTITGRRMSSSNGKPEDVSFDAWRNDKRTWRKKNHLKCDVDAFREDLVGVEVWLSKRLKELGSNWHEQARSDWIKSMKAVERWEDCITPLLVLENEVMTFQLRARTLLAGSSVTVISTAVDKSENEKQLKEAVEGEEEEEEEEDDDLEDTTADDGSFLWPTQKCRTRWINEVKKARSLATLAAALACFVQRLDVLGLSEFAPDDSTVSTRRMKTEKEKRSQKEAAAKKKQKKEEIAEEEESRGRERRDSVDDWEEDCYICTEGGELLCCDGCRHVFHFTCVGLRRVPRGKTFCHHCDASVQPVYPAGTGVSRRAATDEKKRVAADPTETTDEEEEDEPSERMPKKRRIESTAATTMEESDDSDAQVVLDTKSMNADVAAAPRPPEDQWDVECSVCQLGGELLCCDGCPRAFHTQCIGMVKIPEREWFCNECNLQTCGTCSKNKIRLDSHVICGSEDGTRGCDRVFHLKCAKLTAVPEDDWYCKKCQKTLK